MVFSSYSFLFLFLPAFVAVDLALASAPPALRARLRLGWLLAASCVFYGFEHPWYVGLLVLSSSIDFVAGRHLASSTAVRARRRTLVAALTANLLLLAAFKYRHFIVGIADQLLAAAGLPTIGPLFPDAELPVGISFYTFQSMSYTIDVYRRTVKPAPSYPQFLTFVAMFPQLVAGPIVRYADVREFVLTRSPSAASFCQGAFRIMVGLSKKVLIANNVARLASAVFDPPLHHELGLVDTWLGVIAFTVQIYFDFSGYSDMAIGLGQMIGIPLPENFDAPLRAPSLTQFWRRWHMTLSSWLRDYVYLPLGGSRGPARATIRNLLITFTLAGIWHGPGWTYVVFGLLNGVVVVSERFWPARWAPPPALSRVLTFVGVTLLLVPFGSHDLHAALRIGAALAGLAGPGTVHALAPHSAALPLAVLGAGLLIIAFAPTAQDLARRMPRWIVPLAVLSFAAAVAQLLVQRFNPFIYYRF